MIDIDQFPADSETVEKLFQSIIGRPINNDSWKAEQNNRHSINGFIRQFVNSEEFRLRFAQRYHLEVPNPDLIPDPAYRTPSLGTIARPRRIFVIGSCMTNAWNEVIEAENPGLKVDSQLFNNASELEDLPIDQIRETGFAIIQIPLRSILHEAEYFNAAVSDEGREQLARVFDQCVDRLRRNLKAALKYNHQAGLPCFVLNFATPQRNPLGLLMPKYDLTNLSYFIGELNRALYDLIAEERAVHMIDFDEIAATLGKRHVSDEMVNHFNHGSFLADSKWEHDIELTPHGSSDALFKSKRVAIILAIFNEALSAFHTISATEKVKLVIFDLDGTLWRGVAAEHESVNERHSEAWPLGIVEAAAFLKKRGILVAIASKNDPDTVARIWTELYEKRFAFSNFVSRKVSWDPKVNSIAEILAETNLLPGNVLFVDDNPVEREQVKLAYPQMHVIDGPILSWRRSLLWSTETQVPYVTQESANRTASIQSMIQREGLRKEIDPEEYLASLGVQIRIDRIAGASDPRYARAFELLNKTNQFNITGARWSEQDVEALFAAGGCLLAADVSDRLSDYGLTAVMVVRDGECLQFVMSCRVFGLRVEYAMFDRFLKEASGRKRTISYVKTAKNGPSRKFFESLGLSLDKAIEIGASARFTLAADYVMPTQLAAGVRVA